MYAATNAGHPNSVPTRDPSSLFASPSPLNCIVDDDVIDDVIPVIDDVDDVVVGGGGCGEH